MTSNVLTHLYYYWYVNTNIPEKRQWVIDLHLKCLSIYANQFDKITFCLAIDDTTTLEQISEVKRLIITATNREDIIFLIYPNNKNFGEAFFSYNSLIKSPEANELAFYAHCKGVNSIYMSDLNLKLWILLMYFANLQYLDKIKEKFIFEPYITAGTCKIVKDLQLEKEKTSVWHYSGSYYWIDERKFQNLNLANLYPKDRYFTEAFLSYMVPSDKAYNIIQDKTIEESVSQYIKNIKDTSFTIDFINFVKVIETKEKYYGN